MSTIINAECVDQELIITNSPVIASGGIHENFVAFKFCSKWDGLGKTAVFYRNEKEQYCSVLDANNVCEIPHEVTDTEGTFYFGVFGVSDDTTKTTKVLKYKVTQGPKIESLNSSSEPTPDIYQQILSAYGTTNDAIEKEVSERKASILAEETARKQADSTEKAERQAEIAVERARIDALTKMEPGSTMGDAELQDIRIGADGVTYETAGASVRAQVTNMGSKIDNEVADLKSDLSNFTVQQNLFDKSTLTVGGYYFSDGNISANADSYYSEQYIEVEPNVEYSFTSSLYYNLCSCTYDSNKQFVSRNNSHSADGKVTFADGVKYVRFSFYQADGSGFKFAKTADFENVTDEYGKAVDGMKIVNAPFEEVITEDVFVEIVNNESLLVTYGGNYYPSAGGEKIELSNFNWFEFVAPCDFEIWADDNVTDSNDIMLAIYRNGEATINNFVTRLRKDDSTSTNTLPTSNAKMAIPKGQLVVISVNQSNVFKFYAENLTVGEKRFTGNILLNEKQIEQAKGNNINVVVSDSKYLINLNGYTVNLLRDDNDSTRAHLWNIRGIEKDGVVIVPQGTDIVGVLKEVDETDYMGGLHGDETNVEFYILADGKPITENCSCKQLDILMYSHLTRVSTGENVIDRYVHIVMRDNYIEVDTTFKCLVDDFNLSFAYNGGMFAWYDSMADFAMCNTGIINSDGGTSYKRMDYGTDIYHATALIGNSVVTCENLIGHEKETYLGEICYYGNEAEPRIKMYFGTDNNSVWQNGHICKGKARYTFN